MKAVDTSVVVAAFASWHESHEAAVRAVRSRPVLPVACAVEAYAVLTRLPSPHRADPGLVRDFLAASFAGPGIGLADREDGPALIASLVDRGIRGGAVYDAVIAISTPERSRRATTFAAGTEQPLESGDPTRPASWRPGRGAR